MKFAIKRTHNEGRALLSLLHPTDKLLDYKCKGEERLEETMISPTPQLSSDTYIAEIIN